MVQLQPAEGHRHADSRTHDRGAYRRRPLCQASHSELLQGCAGGDRRRRAPLLHLRVRLPAGRLADVRFRLIAPADHRATMYPLRPVLLTILVLLALVGSRPALADPGFLVITPDRGFLGNDETTEALAAFQEQFPNTVLSFVTRDRTEENLRRAIDELRGRSASIDEVVVLPHFLSDGHALYRKAEAALRQIEGISIRFVAPMGTSYLAEELLFDRVRALLPDGFQTASGGHHGHGGSGSHAEDDVDGGMQRGVPRLVVVGSGAASAEEEAAIRADLEPAARRAAEKFGLAASRVAVLYEW